VVKENNRIEIKEKAPAGNHIQRLVVQIDKKDFIKFFKVFNTCI